jgi:hypothetical protein
MRDRLAPQVRRQQGSHRSTDRETGTVRTRRARFLGSAVLVALTAGCGGEVAQLTHDEFVKQGNAICAKGTATINESGATAFASPGSPTEPETVAFASKVIVPTVQDELDQLRSLSAPKGEETRVEEILDKAQAAVDEVRADPALLTQDNGFEEANRLARGYGLSACAG